MHDFTPTAPCSTESSAASPPPAWPSPERAGWRVIHRRLLSIARTRAALDHEEAVWLVAAERAQVHRELGFGSFSEYLMTALGHNARATGERLRVARRLALLPGVSNALEHGELSWSGARELCRVSTPETEEQWLERCRSKGVRFIEKQVSGHRAGELPDDPKDAGAERHILRFEVEGDTLATWREAVERVSAEHGGALSDDDALLAIARLVLGGPKDEGRASYQIAVTVCEECGATTQDGGGEAIRVAEEVAEMVHCDGQYIGDVGGTTHVGQHPARATQTIPPAVRRQVMRRDRGRCVVEGCHSATFVDVHHLRWRKDGGGHDIDNIAVACSSHHRAIHAGRLLVQGTPSTGLSFFHADGTPYGARVLGSPEEAPGQVQPDSAPTRPDPALGERLFSALTNLGFKTKPARQAVEHVLEDVATHTGHPPPIEEALRGALRFLHP